MRSHSIEWLHAKLEKQIQLVESYTEIGGLAFIIKACRLKPYDYLFGERNHNMILHRWWVDEFGNSLNIIKNKRLRITYNDLRLDRHKIVSTDLYYGLSLDQILKMSKIVHVVAGKDEDLYQECGLLSFLGLDNHLRSYLHWHGVWQQVSPLLIGMHNLKLLAGNLDLKYFRELGIKENSVIPCISGGAWISYLPANRDLCTLLDKQYNVIASVINGTYKGQHL